MIEHAASRPDESCSDGTTGGCSRHIAPGNGICIVLNAAIAVCVVGLFSISIAGVVVKRFSRLVLIATTPLLMAALWMDKQPSPRPYQAPAVMPPAGSVPVSGTGNMSPETVERGRQLFAVNCAMCHGATSAARGPVGMKLKPPPPGLDPGMVRALSDDTINKAITLGFGRMPPFKDKLTPRERRELINFLRTRT